VAAVIFGSSIGTMRRPPTVLGLLLIAVVAACDDHAPPAPANGLDAATAQQLFERLDRLVAALESTTRVTAPVGETAGAAPVRTLVADASADLSARLDALEHELIRLRDRPGIAAPAIARTVEPPPMESAAVEQFSNQLKAEGPVHQDARRSVFQMTQQQMLQRFGSPTNTYITDRGHVAWIWQAGTSGFSVVFVDGRVAVFQ
jgi:hypothetical protein